ncbi:MAG: tRNA-dihydrouridine synthase [Parafannyhessea sp.]|uniref:oxidoreductase n=1 Tax=Parafannyhessea sp. TaxID=2847324 RepID=UPI003F1266EE
MAGEKDAAPVAAGAGQSAAGAAAGAGDADPFAPLELGRCGGDSHLRLRNRFALAPMASGRAETDGSVGERLTDHYAERASGGYWGLVECGHHFVSADGRATARQASIASDEDVDGLAREAAVVHEHDTPVFVQISHAGSATGWRLTRKQALSPSGINCPGAKVGHPLPRPMDEGDIARVVEAFGQAARRARLAGFDGVELHAAHGYLLDQFLSPLTNHRTDAYGGPLANRLRITLEALDAVRAQVEGMVVSVRLGGCDYLPGGTTVADACEAAVLLAQHGVDMISVSGGMCYYTRRNTLESGWFAGVSTPVRQALASAGLDVPTMLAGGIRNVDDARRLMARGACDLVGIGRPALNNPRWARRNLRTGARR